MGSADGRLTIIGDAGLDLILGPLAEWPAVGAETIVERNEMRVGFSAANAALAARHLGQACRLVADLGDDLFGRWLAAGLDGIEAHIRHLPGPTTLTVAVSHAAGDRSFITTRGHLDQVSWDSLEPRIGQAQSGSIALLTGVYLMPQIRARYAEILAALRGRGFQIAIDTGWPPETWTAAVRLEALAWLAHCDLLLLNDAEVMGLADCAELEPALRFLAAAMPPGAIAVAKTGSRGAMAVCDGQIFHQSAPTIEAFDTVGAGDSFNAGFLAARLAGRDVSGCLAIGCAAASAIISRFPREAIAPGELAHLLADAREERISA